MSEVIKSLNLLKPIGAVTFSYFANIGRNIAFTGTPISQAVGSPFDLRIIDGQAIEIKLLILLGWGIRYFAQRMDRLHIEKKIGRFKFISYEQSIKAWFCIINIATIFRQTNGNPTLVVGDNLHPFGKIRTTWVYTIVTMVEWASPKEESP